MSSYYIWSIGCQMNKAYAGQVAADLEQLGYSRSEFVDDADLIVVNTCVVRQSAENRVLARLDALIPFKRMHPDAVVALTGCMVDDDVAALKHRFPHVDLFLKAGESAQLVELARSRVSGYRLSATSPPYSPTAFVTIIEGCDNFCTYCIVPYRRGRERSRPVSEVRSQVTSFIGQGVKEVTLLGQNVDSYGHDLAGRPTLADLLCELNPLEGLARIRFLTSHPKDMTGELISTVASLDKVCECISLPVQAGDDDILSSMGRGYTIKYYRSLIEKIRSVIPGVALSTDVIVGFPGETEKQFQATLDVLSEIRFDTVHVAAYSPRPGTLASRNFRDDIPVAEKTNRLQAVERLQEKIAAEINAQLSGLTLEVLVEGVKKGKWWGRTRTGKLVFFEDDTDLLGRLVDIRIEKTSPWSLQGTLRQAE